MMKPTILCVDDEVDNVDALERLFRTKYPVLKATSGKEALKILDQHPDDVGVIITDQRMPNMTGVEFLERTLKSYPNVIRILLTGYTDIQSVIAAVNSGQIYRYLAKPWDPVDLMATVDAAMERFRLGAELREKNQALTAANAELKTLDTAKNQFMMLINHELKTPVTSILNFTELLKESHLNDEQELCVERIFKSTDRLKNLIDDVLLVVAGETKTLKVHQHPFALGELDFAKTGEISEQLRKKKQSVNTQFVEKRIVADKSMIQQVFNRLIHNAVKFGPTGAEISVKSALSSAHRVKFTITNPGPEIPKSVIDKILSPFFIDEDAMNHSSGVGLGLTICQSILKAHSSNLEIKSSGGQVEVNFELPCL
jgi:two-component system sensor histidine kinase/response regulator